MIFKMNSMPKQTAPYTRYIHVPKKLFLIKKTASNYSGGIKIEHDQGTSFK